MGLFRHGCVVCGRPGDAICSSCRRRLVPAPSTRIRGVGKVPALFSYEGVGAAVVQALKFRDGRRAIAPLADEIAARAAHDLCLDELVCTWLPTSARRRRERGFDQSELLAHAVARRLGRPVQARLRRRPGAAQTGRSRDERADNVAFTLTRRAWRSAPGRPTERLLVLDDVCTTGATIRAAAAAFGHLSGHDPHFFTVARTP
jgi:predicted amidophosphoribosyltransferase